MCGQSKKGIILESGQYPILSGLYSDVKKNDFKGSISGFISMLQDHLKTITEDSSNKEFNDELHIQEELIQLQSLARSTGNVHAALRIALDPAELKDYISINDYFDENDDSYFNDKSYDFIHVAGIKLSKELLDFLSSMEEGLLNNLDFLLETRIFKNGEMSILVDIKNFQPNGLFIIIFHRKLKNNLTKDLKKEILNLAVTLKEAKEDGVDKIIFSLIK